MGTLAMPHKHKTGPDGTIILVRRYGTGQEVGVTFRDFDPNS